MSQHWKTVLATSAAVVALASAAAVAPAGAARSVDDEKAKEEVADISKALGKRMHFSETANFTWASSVPPGRLRSISNAAERSYKIFADHAGIVTWRELFGGQKALGVVCGDRRSFNRYTHWYAQTYPVWDKEQFVNMHRGSSWYPTAAPRVNFVSHFKPHDQKFLENINAHLVGHLMADRYAFHNNFTPAWLTESLALYLETRVTGKMQCGCYQDLYGLGVGDEERQHGLPKSKLHSRIKKALKKRQVKNMKGLMRVQALNQLEYQDVLKGYAVVAWMMSQDHAMAKFLKALKKRWPAEINNNWDPAKGRATEQAFKDVFDLTLGGVDAAVDAYAQSKL